MGNGLRTIMQLLSSLVLLNRDVAAVAHQIGQGALFIARGLTIEVKVLHFQVRGLYLEMRGLSPL